MRTAVVLLRHEDGRQITVRLPLGRSDVMEWSIALALDCLGFDNPEPWKIVSWEVLS